MVSCSFSLSFPTDIDIDSNVDKPSVMSGRPLIAYFVVVLACLLSFRLAMEYFMGFMEDLAWVIFNYRNVFLPKHKWDDFMA